MARPTVYQASQLGVETVEGTAVAASKKLQCTGFNPTPNLANQIYRPMGYRVPTTQTRGKEWTEGSIDGVVCYNDLSYLLNSLIKKVTATTPAGATNARRWTYKPLASAADLIDTFTVEMGSSNGAERFTGCRVNALTMAWEQENAPISGSFYGRRMEENFSPLTSPTAIAEAPIDSNNVSLFLGNATTTNHAYTLTITGTPTGGTFTVTHEGNTSAAIAYNANAAAVQTALEALPSIGVGNVTVTGGAGPGTPWVATLNTLLAGLQGATMTATAAFTGGTTPAIAITNTATGSLTRLLACDRFELAFPDVSRPVPVLNANEPSYGYTVDIGYEPTAELRLQHDSASAALMADFRNKQTKLLVLTARGSVIDLLGFYQFIKITVPVKFTGSDRADTDGVWTATYPMAVINDATFAGYCEFIVQNNISAL